MKPNKEDNYVSPGLLKEWIDGLKHKDIRKKREHLHSLIETFPHTTLAPNIDLASWKEFIKILRDLSENDEDKQVRNLCKDAEKAAGSPNFEIIKRLFISRSID